MLEPILELVLTFHLGIEGDCSYLLQVLLVWPCPRLLGSWASTDKNISDDFQNNIQRDNCNLFHGGTTMCCPRSKLFPCTKNIGNLYPTPELTLKLDPGYIGNPYPINKYVQSLITSNMLHNQVTPWCPVF